MLLIQTYAIERRQPKRADFEVLDFLAQWLENRRVRNRRYRYLILKYFLRLLIPLDALVTVAAELGLLHQLVVLRVTPFCIVAALNRRTTVEHPKPVVGVAVVTGPADQGDVMFAIFGVLFEFVCCYFSICAYWRYEKKRGLYQVPPSTCGR